MQRQKNKRMINNICVFVVCFHLFIMLSSGQRRISGGKEVLGDRAYMVYFVKSKFTPKLYSGWTCGGALITELHILTSAACLTDVGLTYAIAGYRRYVPTSLLQMDECTNSKKKKIVKTCIPKPYVLGFAHVPAWANDNDIGIAEVESPYNFSDASYSLQCSYTPKPIAVNFRLQTQKPGQDVVAMGWGHVESLRLPFHVMDHNEEFLREASTLIVDQKLCKEKFNTSSFKVNSEFFQKFICTYGQGNIDSEGNIIDYGELVTECQEDTTETVLPETKTPAHLREIDPGPYPYPEGDVEPIPEPELELDPEPELYPEPEPEQEPELEQEPEPLSWLEPKPIAESYVEREPAPRRELYPWSESGRMTRIRTNQHDYNYDYATPALQYKAVTDEPKQHATIIDKNVNQAQYTDYVENKYENREDKYNYDYDDFTRRLNRKRNRPKSTPTKVTEPRSLRCRKLMQDLYMNTRRQSICQNDHGSPLVSWIGTEEVIIGIATTSLYDKTYRCVPPNLYVSTVYHPWFIKCAVAVKHQDDIPSDEDNLNYARTQCTEPKPDNEKYDIHENVIEWPEDTKKEYQ